MIGLELIEAKTSWHTPLDGLSPERARCAGRSSPRGGKAAPLGLLPLQDTILIPGPVQGSPLWGHWPWPASQGPVPTQMSPSRPAFAPHQMLLGHTVGLWGAVAGFFITATGPFSSVWGPDGHEGGTRQRKDTRRGQGHPSPQWPHPWGSFVLFLDLTEILKWPEGKRL